MCECRQGTSDARFLWRSLALATRAPRSAGVQEQGSLTASGLLWRHEGRLSWTDTATSSYFRATTSPSQNPPIGPLASESATPGIDRLCGCPKTVRQRARPQCRGWREGLFHHSGSARPLSTTNLTSQAFVRCHTRQTIPHIRNGDVCSALKHTRWAALFKTDQPIHIRYFLRRALPPESPLRS